MTSVRRLRHTRGVIATQTILQQQMTEQIPSVRVHVPPLPCWIDKRVVDQAFLMHVEVPERSGFKLIWTDFKSKRWLLMPGAIWGSSSFCPCGTLDAFR